MDSLIDRAVKNLTDTMNFAIERKPGERVVVIYDTSAPLARILLEAYKIAVPDATFVDFDTSSQEGFFELVPSLNPGDLVVLLQSTNFRLNEFRIRIDLFQRGLKTIEYIHLERISEDQFEAYINALAYDPNYYRPLGRKLKEIVDKAEHIVVECAGTKLEYTGGMELTKLNIGDYSDMKNVGGTFPIGEVFSEAKDLRQVNGQVMVYGFAGDDHKVRFYEPFPVDIVEGTLTAPKGPADFQHILELIKGDEEVLVREFGLGLNPAMGKNALVNDITAFERQLGLHLSLGEKHSIYKKPGLNRKHGRYHVDVFVDVEKITIDDAVIFQNGTYHVA